VKPVAKPGGATWKNRSGTDVWGLFTLDAERGILYMPFGEPTSDYWGGDRPGTNLFGTSLVTVDALTGKLKWYFQVVHHDTWDYDLCAPPVLFHVTQKGKKISAVGQLTKTGYVTSPAACTSTVRSRITPPLPA
jgi:quinoprotein glucose dehydrogenase